MQLSTQPRESQPVPRLSPPRIVGTHRQQGVVLADERSTLDRAEHPNDVDKGARRWGRRSLVQSLVVGVARADIGFVRQTLGAGTEQLVVFHAGDVAKP